MPSPLHFSISSDDPDENPLDVSLSGTGQVEGEGPVCTISPASSFIIVEGEELTFTLTASSAAAGANLTIDLFPGDVLPDGSTMSPTLPVSGPSGTSTTFSWTPETGQQGVYLFKYLVTDGSDTTFCAVDIVVNEPSVFAPVCEITPASSFEVFEGEAVTFTVTGTDENVDDVLTIDLADGETLPEGRNHDP